MAKSLCVTCYYGLKRSWEKEGEEGTACYQIQCNGGFYPKNVTFMTVGECSKYDEKKLTRKEFRDLEKEEG